MTADEQAMTQTAADEVWEAFWHLATAICNEIETTAPDLIVVLHCSGAVVWRAVERLWSARCASLCRQVLAHESARHPREYLDQYDDFIEWQYMGEDRAGHMVAWAAGREEWRTALQMRLHAALGAARPSYVLVIDDVVADGWTALTAFGVLMSVLPDAKACLMAGVPGYWRETLGKEWSVTFHPDIVDRMAHAWEKDKQDLFPEAWWRTLGVHCSALVSGLTAGGGDALSSRPISEDFPSAEYLARYLSQDQWLEFPCWISATLDAKFDAWAAGNIPVPVLAPEQYIRPRTYALQAGERAWALAWLQRWSTIDEFAALPLAICGGGKALG